MARRKQQSAGLEDLPDSFRSLKGFDEIVVERNGDSESAHVKGLTDLDEFPGGTWKVSMSLPTDLGVWREHVDPLLVLVGLGYAASQVEAKLTEVVRFCRSEGKTWTQIGEAMGMSKQAAWERFSGED